MHKKKIDSKLVDKVVEFLLLKYGRNHMIGRKGLRTTAKIAVIEGWFKEKDFASFDTTPTSLEEA